MSTLQRISIAAVTTLVLGIVGALPESNHNTKLRVSPSPRTKSRSSDRAVSKNSRLLLRSR
jgi:hypothetical protein